jgi:hypothetical protein
VKKECKTEKSKWKVGIGQEKRKTEKETLEINLKRNQKKREAKKEAEKKERQIEREIAVEHVCIKRGKYLVVGKPM